MVFFKDTLVLDEVFICPNSLLDVVSRIALNNHFMIFAGDDAQLPPINDLYHGQGVPPLMTSDLLKVVAPIRIELNVCKRSDVALHNFGLLCRWETLAHCMDEARRMFQAEGEPAISLTVDNARRQQIKRLTAAWPPKSRACWKAKTGH